MRIIYFPLESYKERYTCQLSAANTGWLHSRWLENEIPVMRIKGDTAFSTAIKTGSVLDATRRPQYACSQVREYLYYLEDEKFSKEDVIYFDDFFHPGIEAIAYAHNLMSRYNNHYKKKGLPRMYALLHAQSVDVYDFTYQMRDWMRYYEMMVGSILDGVFVSCNLLKELVDKAGIGHPTKVHSVGLPFNSDRVKDYFPKEIPEKKRQVIFSSRWDDEKDPSFFLELAYYAKKYDPTIKFVITTSQPKLRSNFGGLLSLLDKALAELPTLELRENQSKTQYYENLLESKIQFNCADQDFISWTLLEALACECIPVYPNFRSFPEVLPSGYLYEKRKVQEAFALINFFMDLPFPEPLKEVYKHQDLTWKRMLDIMEEK